MPKKNSDSPKQKRLSLRAEADSALGQVISYLQSISPNERELVSQTLLARFLPFVLDKGDPVAKGIARQCLAQCLAYQHAIALEWDLPMASVGMVQDNSLVRFPSQCEPEAEEAGEESLNSSQKEFLSLMEQMGV